VSTTLLALKDKSNYAMALPRCSIVPNQADQPHLGFAHVFATKFIGYSGFCHWVVNPGFAKASPRDRQSDAFRPVELFSDALQTSSRQFDVPFAVKAVLTAP
jgi:hypothetical protein